MATVNIAAFAKLLLTTWLLVLMLSAGADSKKKKPPKKEKYPPGSPRGPDYCDKTQFKCQMPEQNDQHILCDCDKYTREIYQPENMTAYRAFALHWHNHYRNRIALDEETMVTATGAKMPAASNMIALSWNYLMEDGARCNAKKGAVPIQHDHCHDLAEGYSSGGGQNIFFGTGKPNCKYNKKSHTVIPHCDVNVNSEYEVMAGRAIFLWYEEMEDINNLSLIDSTYALPPNAGFQIGHVITVLWADSAGLGCGGAFGDPKYYFYTCHYLPTGYILTLPIYKKGPAGTACPAGHPSAADDRYKGLCGKSSVPPAPPPAFFISYVGTKWAIGGSVLQTFSLPTLTLCVAFSIGAIFN